MYYKLTWASIFAQASFHYLNVLWTLLISTAFVCPKASKPSDEMHIPDGTVWNHFRYIRIRRGSSVSIEMLPEWSVLLAHIFISTQKVLQVNGKQMYKAEGLALEGRWFKRCVYIPFRSIMNVMHLWSVTMLLRRKLERHNSFIIQCLLFLTRSHLE